MTYDRQDALLNDPVFVGRVKQAIVKQALVVQVESDATSQHASRVQLAFKVIHDPEFFVTKFARGVLSDDGTYSTDSALDTRIAALWTSYAMVDP